jgi:hypothetical protein
MKEEKTNGSRQPLSTHCVSVCTLYHPTKTNVYIRHALGDPERGRWNVPTIKARLGTYNWSYKADSNQTANTGCSSYKRRWVSQALICNCSSYADSFRNMTQSPKGKNLWGRQTVCSLPSDRDFSFWTLSHLYIYNFFSIVISKTKILGPRRGTYSNKNFHHIFYTIVWARWNKLSRAI